MLLALVRTLETVLSPGGCTQVVGLAATIIVVATIDNNELDWLGQEVYIEVVGEVHCAPRVVVAFGQRSWRSAEHTVSVQFFSTIPVSCVYISLNSLHAFMRII